MPTSAMMSSVVTLGQETLYAYVTAAGRTTRLRLSADKADRLDLFTGRQLLVDLPDRGRRHALVHAVVPAPPFVWVEFELLARLATTAER